MAGPLEDRGAVVPDRTRSRTGIERTTITCTREEGLATPPPAGPQAARHQRWGTFLSHANTDPSNEGFL